MNSLQYSNPVIGKKYLKIVGQFLDYKTSESSYNIILLRQLISKEKKIICCNNEGNEKARTLLKLHQ
jgi:hypothetical protein